MKCEKCGADMRREEEGSTLVWQCPKCGDAFARTSIDVMRSDVTAYSLELLGSPVSTLDSIRAVARYAGCGFLKAKETIEKGGVVLCDDCAVRIKEVANVLDRLGLQYHVTPPFPYF